MDLIKRTRNDRAGIKCPTCGSRTFIIDTRGNGDVLSRRRRCDSDHVFYTLETVSSDAGFHRRVQKENGL